MCLEIAEGYPDVDLDVLKTASFLPDITRERLEFMEQFYDRLRKTINQK